MRADLSALKRAASKKPAKSGSGEPASKKARASAPGVGPSASASAAAPKAKTAPQASAVPSVGRTEERPVGVPSAGDDAASGARGAESGTGRAAALPSERDKGKAPRAERSEPIRQRMGDDGGEYVDIGVSWADNGFEDPEVARKVIEALRLSQDWERTKSRPFGWITQQLYSGMYQHLHIMSLVERVASDSAAMLAELQIKADGATADREVALKLKEAAEKALREREEEHGTEIAVLHAQQASAATASELARKAAEKAEKEIKRLKKKNRALKKARDAAVRRREDDVLLAGMRAVAEYKASADFTVEMTEASTESFQAGINITVDRVRRKFPELDLSDLETDDDEPVVDEAEGSVEAEVPLTAPAETDAGPRTAPGPDESAKAEAFGGGKSDQPAVPASAASRPSSGD